MSLVYIMCIKHLGEEMQHGKNNDALHSPCSYELWCNTALWEGSNHCVPTELENETPI